MFLVIIPFLKKGKVMPILIDDLDNGLGNVITGTGRITGEEYCHVLTQHLAQPVEKIKRYIYSIIDFTEATYVTVTLEDVRSIAEKSLEIAKINPAVTVAITTNEEISLLLAEMWQLLVDESSWDVNVFTNREDLDRWLSEILSKKYKKYQLSFS